MRRQPAFDPPEYVDWKPDPELVAACRRRLAADPERAAVVAGLDRERLLDLYRGLLRCRLHDIALQRWVKQGVLSKAWLGTGEEAVTVGAVHALRRGGPDHDVCGPMIRNAGACFEMGMPLADVLRGALGAADGPARGRDLHIGSPSHGVVAPASMVGALSTVMNGYALAFRARGDDRVALTWIGDGATKHGEVHEALNFAAVRRLPVVFVLQNNQVALGTELARHHRSDGFAAWGRAYGARLLEADGNDVLDVHAAATLAVAACRRGQGPVFVAAETFRMGGHATHDQREARALLPPEAFAAWGRRDPVGLYEELLVTGDVELDPAGADGARPADRADGGNDPSAAATAAPAADREARNRAVLAALEEQVTREVERAAEAALPGREAPFTGDARQEEGEVYG
ncbi:MAG: thiamine pyrophosphate-dependent dehydrogenase E1 component subunit alpha [Gemmatimonadota bacterium]|nr:thiamine pyrophosphate-dependent dehydrogenase E1 component subunit alpha [Gemmatimonadota bacterium]